MSNQNVLLFSKVSDFFQCIKISDFSCAILINVKIHIVFKLIDAELRLQSSFAGNKNISSPLFFVVVAEDCPLRHTLDTFLGKKNFAIIAKFSSFAKVFFRWYQFYARRIWHVASSTCCNSQKKGNIFKHDKNKPEASLVHSPDFANYSTGMEQARTRIQLEQLSARPFWNFG